MSNTHEHLEHAEHAEHHASDPFDKRVAVSMAIVAAILAGISLVGHRKHNEVLHLQGDANRVLTEASAADVEHSNLRGWYQFKKQRQVIYEADADLAEMNHSANEADKKKIAKWRKKAEEYNVPDPERHESLPDLIERGNAKEKLSAELTAKAKGIRDEADHAHHQADRLDLAHLLAEFGLVLCSITILTKRKGWWFAGILCAVLALCATGSAFMLPAHEHTESHDDSHTDKPAKDGEKPANGKPEKKQAEAH